MIMKKMVVKIGGSLLFTKDKIIDSKKITQFCDIITSNNDFDRVIIVCGGGLIARDYINTVRAFNENEAKCDLFGIEFSRINAKLFISLLGDKAYPLVPKDMEGLSAALLFNKIIVMGGLQPGQSTTSVAMEVAEFIKAQKLIILTDVNGIYDKDPKKYSDAKLIKKLTYSQLQDIIFKGSDDNQAAAGEYRIFDAVSLQILKRSKIKIIIMSGNELDEFKKFWNGETKFLGTLISN